MALSIQNERLLWPYIGGYLGIILGSSILVNGSDTVIVVAPLIAILIISIVFARRENRQMRKEEYSDFAIVSALLLLLGIFAFGLLTGEVNGEFLGWFIFLIAPTIGGLVWAIAYFGLKHLPKVFLRA